MHVEAVRECQCSAFLGVVVHFVLVDFSDLLVRQQHHHDVRALDRFGDCLDREARGLGLRPRRTAAAHANRHRNAAVAQVQRVRVALRAVTDDGDLLAFDEREVGVLVVENFHGYSFCSISIELVKRRGRY